MPWLHTPASFSEAAGEHEEGKGGMPTSFSKAAKKIPWLCAHQFQRGGRKVPYLHMPATSTRPWECHNHLSPLTLARQQESATSLHTACTSRAEEECHNSKNSRIL